MTDLIKHLKNIGSPKILVIGDLILDKYVSGKVDRISPEAPIQVLNTSREEYRLGGAANVAHNLVALGARVTLLGIVGSDDTGRRLKRLIQHSQINASGVMLAADRPTSVKTRFIAHN